MMGDERAIAPAGGSPRPWGLWATIGFCCVALAGLLLIQIGVAAVFIIIEMPELRREPVALGKALNSNGVFHAVATIASVPVAAGLLVLFARLRKRYPVRDYLALSRPTRGQLVQWLALTGILMACSDALTLGLGRPLVPTVMVELYRTAGAAPFLNFAILLVAPVCEEVAFRGFLFRGIERSRLGPVGAVALTALIWSAFHVQYDLYGILTIFVMGLLLGAARLRSGSVHLTIAMHFFNNLVATMQVTWLLRA